MADYFESGFCVRERSWHGKELLLDAHPESWDDARLAAGLMWEPRLVPLYFRDAEGEYVEDTNARRVERDDNGAGLGTVSGTFELITHAQMGEVLDAVLDQPNVRFETAGSVRGGRQVYCVVLLDEPYAIRGDVDGAGDQVLTLPYFAVLNSHDGTGACKGLYTQVRVVCANTVQAASADGDRHGAQFSLRHTSGAVERLSEAKAAIAGARDEAKRWKEIAEHLTGLPVTDADQVKFLNAFIPEPPADVVSDRVRSNIARERDKFLHILRESPTNQAIQHNGFGLFSAAVEYCDHLRGYRNRETYMGRQILSAEPMKAKALGLVRELVGAG